VFNQNDVDWYVYLGSMKTADYLIQGINLIFKQNSKRSHIVTWTRDLLLPSSNIPLVLNLSKMTIFLNQLPIKLNRGKFVLPNLTKCQRLVAILTILLHLVVVLKWVLDQWLYPTRPPSPTWKFVLMYYFITLFAAIAAFIVHVNFLKEETVFLLNSALQIEQDSNMKGNCIVHIYYIVVVALSVLAIILMPITCLTFALLRPCMPPTWTSIIYLECKSWDDDGNTGMWFRSFGAILLYYFSLTVVATAVFGIIIVLTYPTEVKLILIELMKSYLTKIRTDDGFLCLKTYRTLQILTDMHNSVFRHPIMSVIVGSVTACESFALYTLITSSSVIPFPGLILFATVGVELFAVIVGPFKVMANPFVKSVELLHSFQPMTGSKLIKRLVRSFPPSKLTLGDGGFFDKATSLVICSQCIDLLITFLLM
ncbi:hypothetical protein Fcan01_11276, partial [Folsomia candida]